MSISKTIILKYYLKDDESGKLYTEKFNSYEEYETWCNSYGDSIEKFTVYGNI